MPCNVLYWLCLFGILWTLLPKFQSFQRLMMLSSNIFSILSTLFYLQIDPKAHYMHACTHTPPPQCSLVSQESWRLFLFFFLLHLFDWDISKDFFFLLIYANFLRNCFLRCFFFCYLIRFSMVFFDLLSVVFIFHNSRKEEFICHVIVESAHSYLVSCTLTGHHSSRGV